MPEYYDLYDRDRNPLGRTHQRGIPLEEDAYHLVVAVWTVNTKGQFLVTRRDGAKRTYPLYWENTCGCAQAGEDALTALKRELFEETGIGITPADVTLLGTSAECHAFVDTYLLLRDVPLSGIVLQKGETMDVKYVYADELDAMIVQGLFAEPVVRRLAPLRGKINRVLTRYTDRLLQE